MNRRPIHEKPAIPPEARILLSCRFVCGIDLWRRIGFWLLSSSSAQSEFRPSGGLGRQVIEFFVCLALAVILFKAFLIEGYVITTGSMAPTLLGYHKQINCPSCSYEFALGISNGQAPERAVCPNCDFAGIETSSLMFNDGDQVLVSKSTYSVRWPKRWEVAVFRNPNDTSEAYVKRIVGLPGEQIQVRRGDVFVNGQIARKSLDVQRGLRILVHDHAHQPVANESADWQPRWTGEQPWWQPRAVGFAVDTRPEKDRAAQWAWLTYRHWIRRGGKHSTRLKLAQWPAAAPFPSPSFDPVDFDEKSSELVCRGAMTDETRERLVGTSKERKFQAAIEQLHTESHIAPLTDFYAYNRQIPGNGDSAVVRDLMVVTKVDFKAGQGEFRIEMNDGSEVYAWVFDTRQQQIRLHMRGSSAPVRTAPLPAKFARETALLEMSLFDRQVMCAVDGDLVFEPWELPPAPRGKPAPRRQVRLGANGIRLHVLSLQVFRDVYYTADGNADMKTWELSNQANQEEFFVLGDNSPISVDSRLWGPEIVLTSQLLMGKPFLVHLPSRTAQLKLGNWQGRLRVPDFSRIRYIR